MSEKTTNGDGDWADRGWLLMLGDMSRVAAAEWRQQSDRQSGTRFHGWVLNRGRRPGVTYPELFILLVREGKWQVGGALLKLKPGLAVFKTDTECLFSKCLGNRLMFWIKVQVLDYWSGLMTVWNLWDLQLWDKLELSLADRQSLTELEQLNNLHLVILCLECP